ncbi:DUF4956 domain-containing protein [Marinicellulosiphila megalodicopiae]|uniref:DUF4956 domain-containing protein n=1 Tax=Marinicellulosiphila megalodicopiae TaxID=2724896 RepID=UPI003BB0DF1E
MEEILMGQSESPISTTHSGFIETILSSGILYTGLINIIASLILLRIIYYKNSPNREMLFGFFIFGNGVFIITALLHDVEMSAGFALGLFAVFSMLRYRTESIDIRDMTYLFITIAIALICAVAPISIISIVIITAFICALTALAESRLLAPKVIENRIVYDRVDNLLPEFRTELIEDLKTRTGLDIIKIQIGNIDYLRECVNIKIFYNA